MKSKTMLKLSCVVSATLLLAACGAEESTPVADVDERMPVGEPYEESYEQYGEAEYGAEDELAAAGVGATQAGAGVIGDVALGRELSEGRIAQEAQEFSAGQTVHVGVDVAEVPEATPVRVVWYGPNDLVMGESIQRVGAQEDYLSFSAENTSNWSPGEYRAEVWLDQNKVEEQNFSVTGARQASGPQQQQQQQDQQSPEAG